MQPNNHKPHLMSNPLRNRMRSPGLRPAFSAGLPGEGMATDQAESNYWQQIMCAPTEIKLCSRCPLKWREIYKSTHCSLGVCHILPKNGCLFLAFECWLWEKCESKRICARWKQSSTTCAPLNQPMESLLLCLLVSLSLVSCCSCTLPA